MEDPDGAILELARTLFERRYPSLVWAVAWSHRLDDLWRLTTDDLNMREIIYIICIEFDYARLRKLTFCSESCGSDGCPLCAERCRTILPSLPSIDEMVAAARSRGLV